MKKIITFILTLLSLNFYAQESDLNIGVNVGLTDSQVKQYSDIVVSADVSYLFGFFEDFKLGSMVSFVYFTPKFIDNANVKPFMYLPVGASVGVQLFDELAYIGSDVGYAIGLSPSGDKGGFYFKPLVGYNLNNSARIQVFYAGILKSEFIYSHIGVGFSFNIFGDRNINAY